VAWNNRPSTDKVAIAAFELAVLLPGVLDALEELPVVVPEPVLGVVSAGDSTEDVAVVGADETAVETAVVAASAVLVTDVEFAPPVGGGLTIWLCGIRGRGSRSAIARNGESRSPKRVVGSRRCKLIEVDRRVGINLRAIGRSSQYQVK
jgi:hypothetical protein